MADTLRNAIDAKQLDLEYQVIWDVGEDVFVGVEALSRWRHPAMGDVPAAVFIPFAERKSLIASLSRLVLERALGQLKLWDEAGVCVPYVSINLSLWELDGKRFAWNVARAVRDAGIEPSRVRFEVTETAIVPCIGSAIESLRELQQEGFRLALDDFGVGCSTLACLHYLPIDAVKIDRSFVHAATRHRRARDVLAGIVDIANALGLEAVIEGVETREQAVLVRDVGSKFAQGFHYGQPMGVGELGRHLADAFPRIRPIRAAASS